MPRTKIVATIGPASSTLPVLKKLIQSGVNVFRFNMSHGTHTTHRAAVKAVREASKAVGKPVGLLFDLQGPKIRFGELPEGGVEVKKGELLVLRTSDASSPPSKGGVGGGLPVGFDRFHECVAPGTKLFFDDGRLQATVVSVTVGEGLRPSRASRVEIRMETAGTIHSHKGINIPDNKIPIPALTDKDKKDAAFALSQKADWLALSFVSAPEDVQELRRLIQEKGKGILPQIIVKIERAKALQNFSEILKVTDAVMVARGDLGIETPIFEVPIRQKQIIEASRKAGKPVVVATQMLDSMTREPIPTRAEVSDVANAVIDHADAVMLSAESASGKYPIESVKMLTSILTETERSRFDDLLPVASANPSFQGGDNGGSLSQLANRRIIDAVVSREPRLLSDRPEVPLFLAVPNEAQIGQELIRWGVIPFLWKGKGSLGPAAVHLKKHGFLKGIRRLALVDDSEIVLFRP